MPLDCAHAKCEIVSDHLVWPTRQERVENLLLARTECRNSARRIQGFVSSVTLPGGRERCLDRVEKNLVVEWFLNEINRAGFHRPHRRRNVALGRQNDNRQKDTHLPKTRLHL